MQYYTYQNADGSDEVGPYHCFNNINFVAEYRNIQTDADIMLLRTKASMRGSTPAEIQENVNSLNK